MPVTNCMWDSFTSTEKSVLDNPAVPADFHLIVSRKGNGFQRLSIILILVTLLLFLPRKDT